jgi:hypothetical protein
MLAVYDVPEEEEEEGSRTPRAASPEHVPDIRGNMGGELGDEEMLDPRTCQLDSRILLQIDDMQVIGWSPPLSSHQARLALIPTPCS